VSLTARQRQEIVTAIRRVTGFSEGVATAVMEEGLGSGPLPESGGAATTPITEAQLDALIAQAFDRPVDVRRVASGGSGTTAVSEAQLDNLIAGAFGRPVRGGAR
jgi:hypothetical protein